MAEGGILTWQIQTIEQHHGPTISPSCDQGLPKPSCGLESANNLQAKEWRLPAAGGKSENKGFQDDLGQLWHQIDHDHQHFESAIAHEVSWSTDTMQGICLKYGITTSGLKQTNQFSGNSLALAPATLMIPIADKNRLKIEKFKRQQSRSLTQNQKISVLRYKVRSLAAGTAVSASEAKAYLQLHEWDLTLALLAAKQDIVEKLQQQQEQQRQQELLQSVATHDSRNPEAYTRDLKPSSVMRDASDFFPGEIELARVWK